MSTFMSMKILSAIFLLLSFLSTRAQKEIPSTNEFVVTGLVKSDLTFAIANIRKYPSKPISDIVITNHLGEPRGTAKQLKGILVKELLKNLELREDNPKLFSEFFLSFIAIDNYRVVYSWNEIFNSPTGDNLYLITSKDGKEIEDMGERILILTPSDFKTGRRHIKGLYKIVIGRVDFP
jgi:hypothetical protein